MLQPTQNTTQSELPLVCVVTATGQEQQADLQKQITTTRKKKPLLIQMIGHPNITEDLTHSNGKTFQ